MRDTHIISDTVLLQILQHSAGSIQTEGTAASQSQCMDGRCYGKRPQEFTYPSFVVISVCSRYYTTIRSFQAVPETIYVFHTPFYGR
ncbi:MAG: hypothetical protein IK119_05165 [Bacteroidales bacterium]|nr:hypothetical protein [Bacteroidales bacterium]